MGSSCESVETFIRYESTMNESHTQAVNMTLVVVDR